MFEVIPCVDIQRGSAVRLVEGDPARETVYFADPLEAARHWRSLGASKLHLVDLDAALGGGDNRESIEAIRRSIDAEIEVGGGIRTLRAAEKWLELVERVVVTTLAVTEPETVAVLVERYGPERVAVSIDARDGRVALRGWRQLSEVDALDFASRMSERGVTRLIYTDVSRDGTLKGVDPEPVARLRERFPYTLFAGGGVGSDADLELYEALGLDGAIVGRALYEGRVAYPRV